MARNFSGMVDTLLKLCNLSDDLHCKTKSSKKDLVLSLHLFIPNILLIFIKRRVFLFTVNLPDSPSQFSWPKILFINCGSVDLAPVVAAPPLTVALEGPDDDG